MKRRGNPNGGTYKELSPDLALEGVERELNVLSHDVRLAGSTTRDRVMTAVYRYGRACARRERALLFEELEQARKQAELQAPR